MRLAKEQGINVKVTLQPHPYPRGGVQGQKGINKSFFLYRLVQTFVTFKEDRFFRKI